LLYKPGNDIRIFGCVVLLIAAVDVNLPSLQQVDLSPLTVILPLTRELALLKPEDNKSLAPRLKNEIATFILTFSKFTVQTSE
jgi:hypothetical protein